MKLLPDTKDSLVLRTDFSDDTAWERLCVAIQQPRGDFRAYVTCVSDPAYAGLTAEGLTILARAGPERSFAFVADHRALTDPEHPVLVVDLFNESGRTFRVIPSEMWAVENNLSIANMGFEEFAEAVDADGVHRGFPSG